MVHRFKLWKDKFLYLHIPPQVDKGRICYYSIHVFLTHPLNKIERGRKVMRVSYDMRGQGGITP